jgi:hypothetical protein
MAKRRRLTEIVGIRSKRTAPFILPHVRWLRSLPPDVRCGVCGRLRRDFYPRPVDVKIFQWARGLACGSLFDFDIGIIHKDLYRDLALGEYGFVTGKCYKGTGDVIKTHVTYYGDSSVTLYGTVRNEKVVCSGCGSSEVEKEGDYFLLASELQGAAAIQDEGGELYLAPRLARRIDWEKYRSIRPITFPVVTDAESVQTMKVTSVGEEYFHWAKPEVMTKPGSARWDDWAH